MNVFPYGVAVVGEKRSGVMIPLLLQLGMPFERVDRSTLSSLPVAVLEGRPDDREGVLAFVRKGGILVTSNCGFYSCCEEIEDHSSSGHIPREGRYGEGWMMYVPAHVLSSLWDDTRAWQAVSYPGLSPACVAASKIQKAGVLRCWRDVLLRAFSKKNLPLIYRWYFPDGARSHVTFRVDADWYDEKQWGETIAALRPVRSCVSWYVTCKDIVDDVFSKMAGVLSEGYEIGSHGFLHYTFSDRPNNEKNMRLAREILSREGIAIRSFVSPSAKWNKGLQRAIAEAGYAYSSEFGYAHDAYPFWPFDGQTCSASLQVPVHSVSPGNFLRSGASKEQIREYFCRTALGLSQACLPVHLYGHPSDLPRLAGLFSEFAKLPSCSFSTLGAYADFWERRGASFRLRYAFVDGNIHIERDSQDDFPLCISWQPDVHHVVGRPPPSFLIQGENVPSAERYISDTSGLPHFIPWKRRLNIRSRIGEWLDYEKVVPSDIHVRHDLRTHLNGILKRLQGL